MSLLLQLLKDYGPVQTKIPDCIIVCTHAKRSTVDLCRALVSMGSEVVFFPVDYSREEDTIDNLSSIGVRIIDHPTKLIPVLKRADCVIEDGARISKLIQEKMVPVKKDFFSVEQTSGGVRYLTEHKPTYPVINVVKLPLSATPCLFSAALA